MIISVDKNIKENNNKDWVSIDEEEKKFIMDKISFIESSNLSQSKILDKFKGNIYYFYIYSNEFVKLNVSVIKNGNICYSYTDYGTAGTVSARKI